ncbi:MAG: ELM1/GtrOC1 family putative glycosyltransferase [Ancalomicrobiaceae bacterium]|nr:ELM1/GtrOC1 family putative glycosyltransferase [Ancalomicrobiaceae bacterium]
MRILTLVDVRAGHARQVAGLAKLIGQSRQVEVVERRVVPRRLVSERVRWLLSHLPFLSPERLLRRSYGIEADEVRGFDLIIGSGRPSILAGILIARMTGARFVYCGRVAGYATDHMALVIVPYAADAHWPRHAYAPIPSPIQPETYSPPRQFVHLDDLAGAHVALLVGGPSSRRGWSTEEWAELCYFVLSAERELGIRWSIATSQRTPLTARDMLQTTFGSLAEAVDWVDFAEEGPGSVDRLYGADAVCVTSDSTSMIAEGLAAMRPVIGIQSHRLTRSRDDAQLALIAAEGSFAEVPLNGLQPAAFAAALVQLRPPIVDPRARLIEVLEPVIGAA